MSQPHQSSAFAVYVRLHSHEDLRTRAGLRLLEAVKRASEQMWPCDEPDLYLDLGSRHDQQELVAAIESGQVRAVLLPSPTHWSRQVDDEGLWSLPNRHGCAVFTLEREGDIASELARLAGAAAAFGAPAPRARIPSPHRLTSSR